MKRIKKGDTVQIICGKDKGKTGKVLRVLSNETHAIVEGLNFTKKHMRRTQDNQKGGILEKENPIQLSNIMLMCKQCNKPVRTKINILQDKTRVRACVKCDSSI